MAELADFYRHAPRGAQTSSPHQQEILDEYLTAALGGTLARFTLDLGSGRGANVAALAARSERVVAADVSDEALWESRALHEDMAERIDWVVLPGRGLPFRSSSFDLCVCTEVLEHVDDLAGTGAELERVTVPGGYLVVSSPNYFNVMGAIKKWKDWRSGRHDFDPWGAHSGGYEGFMTSRRLRATFPNCDVVLERGADYAFALGIRWHPLRWRLSRLLLVRPGRGRLAPWGMQYYLLLRRR